MKQLIGILVFGILFLFSCGTSKKVTSTKESNSYMVMLLDTTFTKHQFDSLCVADTINPNFKKWLNISFNDYETKEYIYEYIYTKKINEDEIVYRVIIENDNYKITKRLTDN